MRSIERRFGQVVLEHPDLSSFICFGRAIAGQNFSRKIISKNFLICVEKSDYSQGDRNTLISHFCHLSKDPEASQIRFIFPPEGFIF